jgi:PadR family transcriptional regulator PadR
MPRKPSLQTLRVLSAMLENVDAEHYGLELSKAAGVPSGTIYPMLARLEREGWVSSRWEEIDPSAEGRPRKRLYTLTGRGAREAREHLSSARRWLAIEPIPARLAMGDA